MLSPPFEFTIIINVYTIVCKIKTKYYILFKQKQAIKSRSKKLEVSLHQLKEVI